MSSNILNVSDVSQLEPYMGKLSDTDRKALSQTIKRFPVRITRHLLSKMRTSEAIAQQFLPRASEVGEMGGQTHCFSGLLHTGLEGVERMYPDRCIIMPQPTCPAYCRFCFRKFYEHSAGKALTYEMLDAALSYVARESQLREVLITGGEPVMDPKRLAYLLCGLRRIGHIGPIRIACRSLIMEPELVDDELIKLLCTHQQLERGKPIEVALHCNHPDEISPETVDRLVALRMSGIHVYNQTVLLQGINVDADVMIDLLRQLRGYGVETYHLFMGGPVLGMEQMRPTLDAAIQLKTALRQRCSGRLIPHLIVTTRLGKVELGVDGWIVEREENSHHVWIRTPYTLALFRSVDKNFELPEDARLDQDGFIVMRYLDGDTLAASNQR